MDALRNVAPVWIIFTEVTHSTSKCQVKTYLDIVVLNWYVKIAAPNNKIVRIVCLAVFGFDICLASVRFLCEKHSGLIFI